MKLTIVLLIAASLQVSAKGYSQKVTLKENNISLQKVFEEIRKQTGYQFFYADEMLVNAKNVSLNIKKGRIEEVLDSCFQNQQLTYTISENTIILKRKLIAPEVNAPPQTSKALEIKGKITDDKGKPLEGATILVKGTNNGTKSDPNGNFSINAEPNSTLIISFVGFESTEINVGNRSTISVQLKLSGAIAGEEVVVTALGIQRQAKSLVYATQTVKTDELVGVRDPNNVINSLQGKVANALITQGSGGPGSGARIILRGNRSLQGSNNALIVVDGVPLNNDTKSSPSSDFGGLQGSDGASNINPDDIESLTVLRGASSAALYGSQAGNGVIVITTKKGTKDKTSVTLNSGIAVESAFALPGMQNSYGQGNGGILLDTIITGDSWGAKMNGQSYINYLGEQRTYSPQPDNIKDFFRNGISTNNSIGVSGGTEKMQTYLSYTNNYIQGIIPKNDLKRHTVNLRISNQVSKRFSTDAKITYINQYIKDRPLNGEINSPAFDMYQTPRSISIADVKRFEFINNVGLPAPTYWPATLPSVYQNPYWMIYRTHNNETRNRLIGFLSAKFKITDWLSISGKANLDKTFDVTENKVSVGTVLNNNKGGNYTEGNSVITEQWYDAMLEGNNTITKNLKINYRVGGIFQDYKSDGNGSSANGLNVPNRFSLNFAVRPSAGSSFTQVQTQSVYGQMNLSFKDAIFLDASLRNDWDSRLPFPNSFQYPSIGAAAVISDLLTLPTSISFLKASINYAEVGNGGQFGLLNSGYLYSPGAGAGGFLQRISIFQIPGLKPEIVKNIEFGIETRFVNNRIGFTATYYKSNSVNQLLVVRLPVATSYDLKYINAGNIQNKGFELLINGTPVKNSNFNWDVAINFSLNRNKVISLSDQVKIFYLTRYGATARTATSVVEEGKSYGDLLAQKWATDAKGNYIVTPGGKPVLEQKQTYIGNYNPKETIGFTNTFNYKRFSLRVLADGRIGGVVVSGTEANLAFSGITEGTTKYREGGWNLGGVDANGQPVSAPVTAQDFWQTVSFKRDGAGQFFAYDATNFRVREVSFGYSIPVSSRLIKTVRISAVGRNLFWLYRGSSILDIPGLGKRKMSFDPDMSLANGNWQGVEYGTIPSTRTFGINLQATF